MFLIVQAVVSFSWTVFKWGLLAGLAGAVVCAVFLYQRVDEEIRARAQAHFARQYPELKVTVRSAELVEGEGIRVRGVSILDPSMAGPRAQMLHLDEVFLCCRADLNGLISGDLEVGRVLVRRPTLRATRQSDGSWNAVKLLRFKASGRRPPAIWIEAGTIEIYDATKAGGAASSLEHVNLHVVPSEKPALPGFGPNTCEFSGTLGGDFFRDIEIDGMIDPESAQWTASGSINDLALSPDLRDALPAEISEKLPLLGTLRAMVALRFRARSGDSQESPIRFELDGQVTQGRIEDPRLPRPVTDLEAGFSASNDGLTIRDLSGSSGPATISIPLFRLAGFTWGGPMWLEARVRELELDRRLRDILPDALRPEWDKFLPAGTIHADVQLQYDGRKWKPDVTVQCLDAEFTYYKFPYRLQHVRGWITWKSDKLCVDVVGDGASRNVRVTGEVVDPAPGSKFYFKATAGGVPLDEKLFQALKENARKAVGALNPRGTIDCLFECWRDRVGEPPHKYLHVTVNNAWARYDRFPYPLGNVSGVIERKDDSWEFRDFRGTNDTGRIACNGRLDVTPEGNQWTLWFTGTNVPLEEELRDALGQPHMQQLWNDLRARGMVDLEATVRRLPGEDKAKLTFLKAELHRDSTSIEPVWMPYRMEQLEGTLTYENGHVSIPQLKSVHGRTTSRAEVDCDFLPDGGWKLRLGNLAVDRLYPDRDLISALPTKLREAVEELKPGGPVNLSGTMEIAHRGDPGAPLTSKWNLRSTFSQGSVDFGVKLENLNGSVTLAGAYDGRTFHSRGELDLDSLTCDGVQFTRVMGPIEIEDDLVLFGSSVRHEPGTPVRTITAQLFGGTLCGNGRVAIRAWPEYELHATLADGDLSAFAQELIVGPQHLRGRMSAWVRIWGAGRSLNGLGGLGRIELRDADIYELPLMAALVKILSVGQPDRSAFSTSDIDFQIHGGHIYLTSITFEGDAFSLEGRGLMDFDRSIQLDFRALLGRREWQLPMVREFFGRVSEEIMVIHVGGTLQDPVRYREPFPGLSEALRQLQGEVQKTTGVSPLFPQSGQRVSNGTRRVPRK